MCLINLIDNYGFESVGFLKKNNEEVFLKKLIPIEKNLSPVETSKNIIHPSGILHMLENSWFQ